MSVTNKNTKSDICQYTFYNYHHRHHHLRAPGVSELHASTMTISGRGGALAGPCGLPPSPLRIAGATGHERGWEGRKREGGALYLFCLFADGVRMRTFFTMNEEARVAPALPSHCIITSRRRARALVVQRTFLTFPGRGGRAARGGVAVPGNVTPSASSSCDAICEWLDTSQCSRQGGKACTAGCRTLARFPVERKTRPARKNNECQCA